MHVRQESPRLPAECYIPAEQVFACTSLPRKGVEDVRNQWRQSSFSQGAQEENRETPANSRTGKLGGEIQIHNLSFRLQTTNGEGMSTSIPELPISRIPLPIKKKRVLLVDSSRAKRELRAEIMRKLGMDVDCAADISEARTWWRADLYNLVLISAENEHGRRDKFCEDIRGATPPQQLAFLVGKPQYLTDSPKADAAAPGSEDEDRALLDEVKPALTNQVMETLSGGWGILEACRRISVVRSAADARTRAIRQRPAPPRDSETARPQKAANSQILSESSSEEMQ